MANLLYRLGRFSARRAWTVIIGWVVLLGLAAGAFLAFGGTLASSFSIPNTATEKVNDQLKAEFPDLAGASASVVFSTADGGTFTAAQKKDIAALLTKVEGADGVSGTMNPFDTEAERADQKQKVADGTTQIADARTKLDAAQSDAENGLTKIQKGQEQIDQGRQQLDAAIEQAKSAGMYEQAAAQFDAQAAQLDAAQTQLDAQKKKVTDGLNTIADQRATLKDKEAELADAGKLLTFAENIRTVSKDGAVAAGTISFHEDLFGLSDDVKHHVAGLLDDADIPGVNVDYSSTIAVDVSGILGPGEITGVLIAGLVLVLMMRALLPAITPLISSIVGVGVGVAGSMAFSDLVDMSSVTPVLGVMLGLAVGIDYSLFILNRHRRQVLAGTEVHESVGLANGTAGNAVVFAGSTVIVALVALTITGISFLGVMGVVGAVCVLIAVLVSLTLTPAILGLLGPRVLGRKKRATIGHPDHSPKPIRPLRTIRTLGAAVVAIVALLAVAAPALSMRLGLPDGASDSTTSTQYHAYKAIEKHFGAGVNGPLLVVANMPNPVADGDDTATEVRIAGQLMDRPDVSAVAPIGVSDSRNVVAFQVVPEQGPSSESTEQLVHDLRALTVQTSQGDATLGVAGQASGNIDVSQKLADVLPVYLIVVIGLSLLIMIVVFRSLLVPLIATGGYVLSLFAALGATTAVYQWGWLSSVFGVHDPGPLLSFAPIIIMGVLFGLAMDYQLFIVSGMREAYAHGMDARRAVVAGLRNGRAVVTAAAIIMGSVFGGFIFSDLTMIRPLGFGLAIGVLFDAFVVRMVIVPALMHLIGRGAWWLPKWLERILPNVDVEGAALERSHPGSGAADAPDAADAEGEPARDPERIPV